MDELFKNIKRPFDGTWEAVESDTIAFEHIMTKLPVKSILMFKSISKLWYKLMSTKYFIVLHQYFSKKNTRFLAFYDANDLQDNIVRQMYLMEANGTYSESYKVPGFESVHNPLLISSFNGLICCVNDISPCPMLYDAEVRICNPATRQVMVLPSSHQSVYMPVFGVLYSKNFHIYTIFKFFSDPIHFEMGFAQCEVYSSKTGKWEVLGMCRTHPLINPNRTHPLINPNRPLAANHVCVNEKLYWFIAEEDNFDAPASILMVDMEHNFKEIHLPISDVKIAFLIEFQGRLCFVDYTGVSFYLWLFDERNESWYLKDIPPFPGNWLEVARFDSVVAHKHEILFVYKDVAGHRHEILYDVSHTNWREFRIAEDDRDQAISVFPFFETLVSCSGDWQ